MSFIFFTTKEKIFNTNTNCLNNALEVYSKLMNTPTTNTNYQKISNEYEIWNKMANELQKLFNFYNKLALQIKRTLVLRFLSVNYNIFIFNNIQNNQNQIFFNKILNEKKKLIHDLKFLKKGFFYLIFYFI